MSSSDHFYTANYQLRKTDHAHWHRLRSKRHILRSQLGFNEVAQSRPKACQGCVHYHGIAYGHTAATRTLLVCGFHPYGWGDGCPCPDWAGAS
ncbi:MAG: hypothetical protein VKK04_09335 [Synechococcales bacterium]|nr:hypothetical protein [Synechococcales bacterium]